MKRLRSYFLLLVVLCCFFAYADQAYAVDTVLKVAVNCHMPPYQFLDGNGNPVGIHIELMDEIAGNLGYTIEYVLADGNDACYKMLNDREADAVLGVYSDSNYRDKVLYTDEIATSSICIMTSSGYKKKSRLTGAFEFKTSGLSDLNSVNVTEGLIVANQEKLFRLLLDGEVDVIAGVKDGLIYQLYNLGREHDYQIITNYIDTISFYIAVQQGDNVLLKSLNGAIVNLKTNGVYSEIKDRWIVDESRNNLDKLRKNLKGAMIAVAVIGLSAMVYVYVSYKFRAFLKKQVEEKNAELYGANAQLKKNLKQLENEVRLRASLIDSSPNGMLMFDTGFRITAMNKRAQKIALIEGPVIGESALMLPVFGDILKTDGDTVFGGPEGRRADTPQAFCHHADSIFRYTIHRTKSGETVNGALLTVEDVTLEERRKQEVFESEKNAALNKIIASVAHEIKNPLMSIKMFTSLIDSKKDNPEFWSSFKEFVPNEVDRINRLIVELINYARPMKVEMQAIDVDRLFDDCLQLAKTASASCREKLCIEVEVERGLAFKGSVDNIKQVLLNLILNGIESMKKKLSGAGDSKLTLKLSAKDIDGFVLLTVCDEGVGMSEEELKQCTEPFYSTKVGGTGLGLTVSKQFVERNGGELSIGSQMGRETVCTLKFRRHYET